MRTTCGSVLTLLVLLVGGSSAQAADQSILGSSLSLKNPNTPQQTKLTGKANEKASSNTIVGSPTVTGATLTVRANGGTSSSQTFNLPQTTSPATGRPYWTGDPVKGFKYRDSKYENGPIKSAQIRKSSKGTFQIKVSGSGRVLPLTVLPPSPGTDGCMLLQITGGDSYSVLFAPLDGVIKNKGPLQYTHNKVSLEGTCAPTTTTTTPTSTTTTTTLPSCAPNCVLGQACLINADCLSQTCSGGFCRCPTTSFSVTMSSVGDGGDGDFSHEWPGGNSGSACATGGECCVNLSRPSGNIDLLGTLGDGWGVSGVTGFTGGCSADFCAQNPTCNATFAIGHCESNRPSCSNGLGSASHTVNVTCLQ